MPDRSVLVTGATGFVGSRLCVHLQSQGHRVIACVREGAKTNRLPADIELRFIRDFDQPLAEIVAGVDAVIHLAARAHILKEEISDPLTAFRKVNVEGTANFVRASAAAGVRRFLFLSSIGVNGNQTHGVPFSAEDRPAYSSPYGQAKWEAEQQLRQLATGAMEWVIVRPPLVYGGHAPGNFGLLLRLVAKRLPLPLASVCNQRSFIGVDNLCDFLSYLLDAPAAKDQTFVASDAEDVSTPDLLRTLSNAMAIRPRLFPFPVGLLRGAARLAGRTETMDRLTGDLVVDKTKVRTLLSWHPPVRLQDGLAQAAREFMQR